MASFRRVIPSKCSHGDSTYELSRRCGLVRTAQRQGINPRVEAVGDVLLYPCLHYNTEVNMGHFKVPLMLNKVPLKINRGTLKCASFTYASKSFWGIFTKVLLIELKLGHFNGVPKIPNRGILSEELNKILNRILFSNLKPFFSFFLACKAFLGGMG
jgi:hypothetical protein